MLDHFAVSVLAAPILVVGGFVLLADRMRPDSAARVFAWAAVVTSAACALDLVVFALVALARVPAVASSGGWSVSAADAGVAPLPWLAGVAAVWALAGLAAAVIGWGRYRRRLRAVWSTIDGGAASDGLVVVADARPSAFALPAHRSRPGCVVVTSGLRDSLGEREYAAVIAHERAHLAGAHDRLVRLVRLAASVQPAFWWAVSRMEYLVERAADEEAAHVTGSRVGVARAIALAALAAHEDGDRPGAGRPAVSARPGVVPRRVAAMAGAPRSARWPLAGLPALALATAVWTVECVYDLVELLALS